MRNFLIILCLALGITTGLWAQVETPGNYGDAMRWYERSARAGSAPAQFYLGMMHETGTNRAAARSQAARWFRKAADQGHAAAQFNLGTLYRYGAGVPRDNIQAWAWFDSAAAAGHGDAAEGCDLLSI